jgi:septal ring factor EnvC (AmiA/AmiB activator)
LFPQAELDNKQRDIEQLDARIVRQQSDIDQLRSQYRTAQANYDRQVVEHASAVNKLSSVEVALSVASQRIQQCESDLAAAQRDKVTERALFTNVCHTFYKHAVCKRTPVFLTVMAVLSCEALFGVV